MKKLDINDLVCSKLADDMGYITKRYQQDGRDCYAVEGLKSRFLAFRRALQPVEDCYGNKETVNLDKRQKQRAAAKRRLCA